MTDSCAPERPLRERSSSRRGQVRRGRCSAARRALGARLSGADGRECDESECAVNGGRHRGGGSGNVMPGVRWSEGVQTPPPGDPPGDRGRKVAAPTLPRDPRGPRMRRVARDRGVGRAEAAPSRQKDIGNCHEESGRLLMYLTGVNQSLPLGLTATRPLPGIFWKGSTVSANGATRTTSRLERLA